MHVISLQSRYTGSISMASICAITHTIILYLHSNACNYLYISHGSGKHSTCQVVKSLLGDNDMVAISIVFQYY